MGLIQVPRGIQTKRGYAPSDIAHSGAQSVDPRAWNQLSNLWPLFLSAKKAQNLAGPRSADGEGHAPFGVLSSVGRVADFNAAHWLNISGVGVEQDTSFTLLSYVRRNNDSNPHQVLFVGGGGTQLEVWSNKTVRTEFIYWDGSTAHGVTDAPPIPVDEWVLIAGTYNHSVGEWLLYFGEDLVGSASDAQQTVTSDWTGSAIGRHETAGREWNGEMAFAAVADRALSAGEIKSLSVDPFAPFRRRPLLVPVSSGGESVTVSEGSLGGDAWAAVATVSSALTEAAQAAETYNAIASVGASLTEAVAAQDASGGPATALGAVSEAAELTDLASAVSQASAAITAGAAAGESWVAQAQVVMDLVESAAAAETISEASTDAEQAAVSEGSQAGDAFTAAIQAVANLTDSASAADALVATVTALASLTETAQAGSSFTAASLELAQTSITAGAAASDTHTAVGQILGALTEAIDAGAIYTAAASVAAAISAGVTAGDSWSAVVPGTGYLVASAITVTAALKGSGKITPALSGTGSVKPN